MSVHFIYLSDTSGIACFSVFLLYVASKRGFPRKFSRFVLFRPVKKGSCNLLCVLDLQKQEQTENLKIEKWGMDWANSIS